MARNPCVAFACTCGRVQGRVAPATPRSGTHLECYCADCRAAELWFDQPDPAPGGVRIYQTTPDAITFDAGQDLLGVMRLGPRGVMRWHATCCKAPLFNTLANPKLPFAGLHVARLDDPAPIGPVVARGFVPRPGGGTKHQGATMMFWRIFSRLGAARLSGRWRRTPFFDIETGEPVATPTMPDKQERAALYPSQRRTSG